MKTIVIFFLFCASILIPAHSQENNPYLNILVFTKTDGYRHASTPSAVKMIYEIGYERNWSVTATDDARFFDNLRLPNYDVVVFANTSEDVFNAGQQDALKKWYRSGKGIVAIHGAADTEYDWPWFGSVVGSHFKTHPKPQEGTLILENTTHPATRHFSGMKNWTTFDEWYSFKDNPRNRVNVLMSLDESSLADNKPEALMGDHPLIWFQEFDGGRSLYVGKGHTDEVYNDEMFRKLVLEAIEWASGRWEYLFDGESLEGWEIKGGKGEFYVEDGEIVAETRLGNPNSFLCTSKKYKNFVLELDFKVDPELNTGVQIRSDVLREDLTTAYINGRMETVQRTFPKGTVYGYQIDIDPSERAWTGGFYEEGRRGWLKNLEDNPKAQKAFKQNEWNHLKIIADGKRIQTWINGVKAVDVQDDLMTSGFIGLQLHSISSKSKEGKTIRWNNLKLLPLK